MLIIFYFIILSWLFIVIYIYNYILVYIYNYILAFSRFASIKHSRVNEALNILLTLPHTHDVNYLVWWILVRDSTSCRSFTCSAVFLWRGKTLESNDMNGREGEGRYELQPTTTQGDYRQHEVHVFFILQNPKNIDKRSRSGRWDWHQDKHLHQLHQWQPTTTQRKQQQPKDKKR